MAETKKKTTAKKRRVADSRRGLWVVQFGRMKQYGDQVIEGPGQIIRRANLLNDGKLLSAGYVIPLRKDVDYETCPTCGLMFTGSSIAGAYKGHLEQARHDINDKIDVDGPAKGKKVTTQRTGNEDSPDSDGGGDWDLETEGAPPPTRVRGSAETVRVR